MQRHAVRSLSIGNNSTVFYNDRYLDGQVFVLFAKGPSMSFYPIFISSLYRCNQDNIVINLEQYEFLISHNYILEMKLKKLFTYSKLYPDCIQSF